MLHCSAAASTGQALFSVMSDAASDRPGVTGWVTRLRSKEVKTARSHKRGGFWSLSEWIMINGHPCPPTGTPLELLVGLSQEIVIHLLQTVTGLLGHSSCHNSLSSQEAGGKSCV